MDKYENYTDLKKSEKENCDFKIEHTDIDSHITIIAPHGGKIESKTTEIAKLIAGDSYNYYSFIGQKNNNNRHLHITSHKFNEPKALELVGKSEIVIAIHGCTDKQGKKENKKDYGKHIFIGGLNEEIKKELEKLLKNAGFSINKDFFPGTCPKNICNRGTTGKGIQFELTKSFRNDAMCRDKFIETVRRFLLTQTI